MFYGLDETKQKILRHTLAIVDTLYKRTFHADHLITVERCMGFWDDPKFKQALDATAKTPQERSLVWRLHTQCWAAGQCLAIDGDFVECGVYRGFCSEFLIHYLSLSDTDKTLFLYDTFEGIPPQHRGGSPVRPGGYREQGLHEQVQARFAPHRCARVIKGVVPDVFAETCPERVSYLHLDMNSASAEVGALEALFERISAGGMIVLDDYGWQWYRAQKAAEDAFFSQRGYAVLEIPTGQGLVVKR
jgi:hypothetical protein